jgi:hypothetical protein
MVNAPMNMLKDSLDIHRGSIYTVSYSQYIVTWPQDMLTGSRNTLSGSQNILTIPLEMANGLMIILTVFLDTLGRSLNKVNISQDIDAGSQDMVTVSQDIVNPP